MRGGVRKPKLRFHLACIKCGNIKDHDNNIIDCDKCGGLFMPVRDEEFISRMIGHGRKARKHFDDIRYGYTSRRYPYESGVFMWKEHLVPGFPSDAILSLREGRTDLFEPPGWLRREVGLKHLFIKMEGQGPSESFKDRGMPMAISEARRLQIQHPELKIEAVACASTGDTSASAAVFSAYYRDVLGCYVFLPYEKISPGQLAQAMMFGATVVAIKHKDGFDGCMRLIKEFCARNKKLVLVNSANAFRIMGQESISLEIFQDLRWQAPDWIFLPVGNAGNVTAQMLSCLRAKALGLIDRLPGIGITQPKHTNTLVRWARSGFTKYEPGPFHDTIASATNIQDPVSFPRVELLYKHFPRLLFFEVDDLEIQRTRARFNRAGCDLCPQGAIAASGAVRAREENLIKENETITIISTASGMKFPTSAIDHHLEGDKADFANPYIVVEDATLQGVEAAISQAR